MANSTLYLTLGGGLLIIVIARLLRVGRRPANYPPGPPTIPILGNIHQMPDRDAHLQFQKWAKEFGPVYSLMLGTKCMVVLSSGEAVNELLGKRGIDYSGRPESYVGMDLCSGGLRFLLMPYGPTWRLMRKLAHGLLNIVVAKSYTSYQLLENKQMLHDLLHDPEDFLGHIRRYSNSLTMSMCYGIRSPSFDDPKIKQLFEGFNDFVNFALAPSSQIADFYPFLRSLPLPMFAKAKAMHIREKALYVGHWLGVKDKVAAGTARPCFSTDLINMQKQDSEYISDDMAAYLAGSFLEAGSDTTSSTLYAFVQAMLVFPEVQKKAQAELDALVGEGRLPTAEDENSLPYIRACIKETCRWMPTTILGAAPHACTKEGGDEYMSYHIPKGAVMLINVYTLNMDETRFPSPRDFVPDRYIDADDTVSLFDSAVNPDVSKRDQFTFGAGRHLCQGMHLAERSLFLGMARILWAFDIVPVLGEDGKPVLPDIDEYTQGTVCLPVPFKANFKPRSEKRRQMVEEEWKQAKELLDPETKQWKDIPQGMKFTQI